ncbi:hypothetical protein ACTD5D_21230 [Nocardia takedensis]|uniref:hypothetical protein n=1 Tax=Nocardia takedensis TaxID=259390 RepID=UPI003F776765
MLPGLGTTAAQAWRLLADTGASRDRSTLDLLWKTFAVRALREPTHLLTAPRFDLAGEPRLSETDTADITAEARKSIDGLRARAETGHLNLEVASDIALAALRTAELLDHLGAAGPELDRAVIDVLDRTLHPVLLNARRGAEFVTRYGALDEQLFARFVRPALEPERAVDQPLGQRFCAEVATWLTGPTTPDFAALRREPNLIATIRYHVHADAVFRRISTDPESRSRAALPVPIALWRALYETQQPNWPDPDIGPLFAVPTELADLLVVDKYFRGAIPLHLYRRPLRAARSSADLDIVVRHIADRVNGAAENGPPRAVTERDALTASWARLAAMNWRDADTSSLSRCRAVLADYGARPGPQPAAPLDFHLGIAYLLVRSNQRYVASSPLPEEHARAVIDALLREWDDSVETLCTLIDHRCVKASWVCGLAVLTAQDAPPSDLTDQDPLRRLIGPDQRTLFETVARRLLRSPHRWSAPATPKALIAAVRAHLDTQTHDDLTRLRGFTFQWRDRMAGNGARP